jgi:hypothetical protein
MLDITTLAAWGEFIGGIGVIASLIYLAGQIRQNSRLLRASSSAVTTEATNAVSRLIAEDPEAARLYWAGLADRSSVSDSDRQRFDPMLSMTLGAFSQEYDFFQDGMMGERVWNRRKRSMTWLMQQRGPQQWWSDWGRALYEPEFCDFVDGLIREGEAAE